MVNCIFCRIIEGQIPSKKVYEDDQVYVFHDIQPAAPVHLLLIPKKHIASMNDLTEEDGLMIGHLHHVAQLVAKQLGVAETGYRIVNNCGPDAGQVVFHLHFHLLAGSTLSPLGHLKS
jgi:histidine triad (HIT) family protein